MYNEWSLEAFYHGIDDPALAKDMARLEEIIASFKKAVHALTGEDPRAELRRIVEIEEESAILGRRFGGYFSLRRSANSADTEGAKFSTKIQNLMASKTKATQWSTA